MKAFIEIKDCCECPYHDQDNVQTPDSFDNFLDIRCRKVISSDGKGRLICQVDGPEKAPVPDWCPLVAEYYESIREQLRLSYEHENRCCCIREDHRLAKCTDKLWLAEQILLQLRSESFSEFVYSPHQFERDNFLVYAISLLKRESSIRGKLEFECLSAEDLEIIDNNEIVTTGMRAAKIIEDFKQGKREAEAKGSSMTLGSELATPLAILMADTLEVPWKTRTILRTDVSISLRFFDRSKDSPASLRFFDRYKDAGCNSYPVESAELNYYWHWDRVTIGTKEKDELLTSSMDKLLTNNNKAALCLILKEILASKILRFFSMSMVKKSLRHRLTYQHNFLLQPFKAPALKAGVFLCSIR